MRKWDWAECKWDRTDAHALHHAEVLLTARQRRHQPAARHRAHLHIRRAHTYARSAARQMRARGTTRGTMRGTMRACIAERAVRCMRRRRHSWRVAAKGIPPLPGTAAAARCRRRCYGEPYRSRSSYLQRRPVHTPTVWHGMAWRGMVRHGILWRGTS